VNGKTTKFITSANFLTSGDDFLRILVPIIDHEEQGRRVENIEKEDQETPGLLIANDLCTCKDSNLG
jgi:hypothetical protein